MEIVTHNGKSYIEITFTEYENMRLEREIQRQVKNKRQTYTKHDMFTDALDIFGAKTTPRRRY